MPQYKFVLQVIITAQQEQATTILKIYNITVIFKPLKITKNNTNNLRIYKKL